MSNWSIKFSADSVIGHAWGKTILEEFAAYNACISILEHSSGSVYLTIVEKGSDELLVLDFGSFSQAATYKRWGSTRVTYRGTHGGLFIAFPDATSLEGFEGCCDRVFLVQCGQGVAPTLKDLQDLGLVPLPRFIGDFLVGLPDDDVSNPLPFWSDTSSVSSDTNSDSVVDTVDPFSDGELATMIGEIGDVEIGDVF